MTVHAGLKNDAVLDYLRGRRSARVKDIVEPGPAPDMLDKILEAGLRVPDHGKLCPFYLMVFEGEARVEAGEIFAEISGDPADAQRFLRAPVVVAVIHRARRSKHPMWEQILSAGALCHNISLVAHASGFAATWLTEWMAYDDAVKARLGLDARDHVAGFLYIGTPATQPEERERPALEEFVTRWSPDAEIKKGDHHDRPKFGFPDLGVQAFKEL